MYLDVAIQLSIAFFDTAENYEYSKRLFASTSPIIQILPRDIQVCVSNDFLIEAASLYNLLHSFPN
jgi:hypothetical protein